VLFVLTGQARAAIHDAMKRGSMMLRAEAGLRMSNSVDAGHLRAFIERIERLEEDKREIAGDIKEVYAEAKANGYDAKVMRKVISLRRMDHEKRREEEEMLDLYLNALGDL
jgi:uncharacterized protein (UPF0335 family)